MLLTSVGSGSALAAEPVVVVVAATVPAAGDVSSSITPATARTPTTRPTETAPPRKETRVRMPDMRARTCQPFLKLPSCRPKEPQLFKDSYEAEPPGPGSAPVMFERMLEPR